MKEWEFPGSFFVSCQRLCYDTRREVSILEQTIPKTEKGMDLASTQRWSLEQQFNRNGCGMEDVGKRLLKGGRREY